MSSTTKKKPVPFWVKRGLGVLFAGALLAALGTAPGSAGVPVPSIQISGAGAPTVPRYNGGDGADCDSAANKIEGTNGDDFLQGTSGPDCILGFGGNDTINADAGFDDIFAGSGNDTVFTGAGDDYVEGDPCHEAGNPESYLPPSNSNAVCDDAGNDYIAGEAADDGLFGAAGSDFVDGGAHLRGDIANGGTDGALGDPQTSIDTCTGGETTSRRRTTQSNFIPLPPPLPQIPLTTTTQIFEECENKI